MMQESGIKLYTIGCAGYVVGCAGYVVWVAQPMWWVAQAMWSGLRRLCGGFYENNAKLSQTQFELGLRLSLAKLNSNLFSHPRMEVLICRYPYNGNSTKNGHYETLETAQINESPVY